MVLQIRLDDDTSVIRRPNYRISDRALFFLASERPAKLLDNLSMNIWDTIAEPVTMKVLRSKFSSEADDVIEAFLDDRLCEIVESFSTDRKRILVIEPHADDAALSVGGLMMLRRNECSFKIATIANRSNFTSYYYLDRDFFDVERVIEIRNSESQCVARILGGEHIVGSKTDAALRYRDENWSLDFFRRHRQSIAAATTRAPKVSDDQSWADAVRSIVVTTNFDEIWVPLGSPHIDHDLVARACLSLIKSEPELFLGRKIRIYEDVPYVTRYSKHMEKRLSELARDGFCLVSEITAVDTVWREKLRLISVYSSQFKIGAMTTDIEASARGKTVEAEYAECLWHVVEVPTHPTSVQNGIEETVRRTCAEGEALWISRNKDANVLRFVLQAPTGRWRDDLQLFCEAFPHTRFEVFAADIAVAEVADIKTERVRVIPISSRMFGWSIAWLHLVFWWQKPTVIHVGQNARLKGKLFAFTLPFCDTLVTDTMNDLVRSLENR